MVCPCAIVGKSISPQMATICISPFATNMPSLVIVEYSKRKIKYSQGYLRYQREEVSGRLRQ